MPKIVSDRSMRAKMMCIRLQQIAIHKNEKGKMVAQKTIRMKGISPYIRYSLTWETTHNLPTNFVFSMIVSVVV